MTEKDKRTVSVLNIIADKLEDVQKCENPKLLAQSICIIDELIKELGG